MAVNRLRITLIRIHLPTSLRFTDRVFNSGTKTMEVYDEVAKDIVLAAMDGERVTSPVTRAHTPHNSTHVSLDQPQLILTHRDQSTQHMSLGNFAPITA